MSPPFTVNYSAYLHVTNAEIFCDLFLHYALFVLFMYFCHRFVCKFSGAASFASRVVGANKKPTFIAGVFHVVGLCSEKQMRGITTTSKVALVQNKHSIRNVSTMRHHGYAVGLFEFSIEPKASISEFGNAFCPDPAIPMWPIPRSFINITPESIRLCYRKFVHRLTASTVSLVGPCSAQTLRGLSYCSLVGAQ